MTPEDLLSDEESLFTAPGVLEIEYLPRLMPFREDKQKYIAHCIDRLPSVSTNLVIQGPSGIGKTACVKWVFREFREKGSEDISLVYINCWRNDTLQKIAIDLCSQFGIQTSYRGQEEIQRAAFHRLKSMGPVAIVFDEVDRLQDDTLLYNFMEELSHKTIILISTRKEFLAELDSRVRSRLMPETMEFAPYTLDQTQEILSERREAAFVTGVWEANAFEIVVRKCFQQKDIRTGLALMKNAGIAAESDASRKITMSHVKEAIEKMNIGSGEAAKLSDF